MDLTSNISRTKHKAIAHHPTREIEFESFAGGNDIQHNIVRLVDNDKIFAKHDDHSYQAAQLNRCIPLNMQTSF